MTRWDDPQPPSSSRSDLDVRAGGRSTVSTVVWTAAAAAILFAVVFFASGPAPPRPEATAGLGVLADPGLTYDPVRAGETLPSGFRQVLPRDAILPIYDPAFRTDVGNDAWSDDMLVIGIAFDGDAKAYPVSFLNRREMVVDSIAGIPVLVTW